MWVTCDVTWVLADCRRLFTQEPNFLSRCLVSRFPDLLIQDALVDGLVHNGVVTYDRLLALTPQEIATILQSTEQLNITNLDSVSQIFNYVNLYTSKQSREVIGTSWLEVAEQTPDISCRARAYNLAARLLDESEDKHRALGQSTTYDALVMFAHGDLEDDLRDRLAESVTQLSHLPEFSYLKALYELVHEYVGFKEESDPFMVALRGTRAVLAIENLEVAIARDESLTQFWSSISFVTLRQEIEAKLATLSSQLESAVITEVKGDLQQGQPSTLQCLVRTIGLPVYELTIRLRSTPELETFTQKRDLRVVNINWTNVNFTVTPTMGGRVRIPLDMTYVDVNQVKHEVVREHEITVRRAPVTRAEDFATIPNPFVAGPGIVIQSMFFGRKEALSAAVNSIQYTNQPYAIAGPRRIGKTSFLRALERDIQKTPGLIPIFFDIESVTTPLEFLGRLGESALVTVADSDLQDYVDRSSIIGEVAEAIAVIDQLGFLRGIESEEPGMLKKQLAMRKSEAVFLAIDSMLIKHGFKCVVLLDEIGSLGRMNAASSILGFLRFLIQKLQSFVFVVAGPDILFELTSDEHPFFNLFAKLPLRGLSKDESVALMTKPVPQVEYEDTAIDLLYTTTSGNPYYLQALCKALVDLLNQERRYRVTLADAESIIEHAVNQLDDQSRFQWRDTSPVEHLVLVPVSLNIPRVML